MKALEAVIQLREVLKIATSKMKGRQAFRDLIKIGRRSVAICGMDILHPNFKLSILSWVVIIDATTYIFVNFLNIFIFRDTLVQLCFCLVTYTFGFQGLCRIFYLTAQQDRFKKLESEIFKYKTFGSDELEEEDTYNKYGVFAKLLGIVFAVAFISSGLISVLYPIPEIVLTGELLLPFGFVIPGLDYKTHPGYDITYFYQIMQVVFVVPGFLGIQIFYVAFILYTCFQSELIQIKIKKFGFKVLNGRGDDFEIEAKKIFRLYHEFLAYHMLLEEQYNVTFAFDIICIPFQIIVTMFVCMQTLWIPGFGIMISVTSIFLFGCILGVFVEVKCEQLSQAIYYFPWHLIKPKDRKDWCFFLQATQNISGLSCGGFLPLNLNTFVQVR